MRRTPAGTIDHLIEAYVQILHYHRLLGDIRDTAEMAWRPRAEVAGVATMLQRAAAGLGSAIRNIDDPAARKKLSEAIADVGT